MSEGNQSTVKLGLWLSFVAFLLIVIVFREKITNIEFGSEGVKASMGMAATKDVQNMSDEQRKDSEQQLQTRARSLKKEAQDEPQATTVATQPQPIAVESSVNSTSQPAPFTIPNLAGYWTGSTGIPYRIDQQGNVITVTEFDPLGRGMTAYAAGYITGQTFSLRGSTIANTPGVLTLTISSDRQLTGQYADTYTGIVIPLQLSR